MIYFIQLYKISFDIILIFRQEMQQVINVNKLLSFINKNGITVKFKDFLRNLSINEKLKLTSINPTDLLNQCLSINSHKTNKKQPKDPQKVEQGISWRKKQYKLFIWISLYYRYINNLQIIQLKDQDYQFLQSIFPQQNITILKYELISLFSNVNKSNWSQQQIGLLTTIINSKINQKKEILWKNISYELFCASSQKYIRTLHQCRQVWHNHLNPHLNKSDWKHYQDQRLLSLIEQYGKKWAVIADKFNQTRTEHMIKNRYYALMKRSANKRQSIKRQKYYNQIISEIHSKRSLNSEIKQNRSSPIQVQSIKERQDENPETNCVTKTDLNSLSLQSSSQISEKVNINNNQYIQYSLHQHQSEINNEIQQVIDYSLNQLESFEVNFKDHLTLSITDQIVQKLGCAHFQQLQNLLEQKQRQYQHIDLYRYFSE